MDFYRNVTVSGNYHQQEHVLASPSCSKPGAALTPTRSLDDLFSAQNTEVDVSMEWLSVFVEDCLSSGGICLPPAPISATSAENTNTTTTTKPSKPLGQKFQQNPSNSLEKFIIPGRARRKRKRITSVKSRNPLSSWCNSSHLTLHFPTLDTPLLHPQAYWLADSELIMPKKEPTTSNNVRDSEGQEEEEKVTTVSTNNNSKESLVISEGSNSGQQQQPRRCTHCLAQRTPQWRTGPLGPKTLCNACGVRYKSGRLLPEYRPAKSPTFVSHLHSSSHKKVLEMRRASTSSAAAAAVFNS